MAHLMEHILFLRTKDNRDVKKEITDHGALWNGTTSSDRLIQHHLGVALRRATVAAVYEASGGNPLYALELARAALRPQAKRTMLTGTDLPSSQRDLIGHRITAVGNGAMQALLVVASAAEPTFELINAVLGPSGAAGLQPAIDASLVEQTRGRLRFTHPLLAAAVYEAADPSRRRRIQLILARLAADPEEKGRLLADAVQLPDAEAAQTIEEAARAAAARGAPASAALLAERAAELTPPTCFREMGAAAAGGRGLLLGCRRRPMVLRALADAGCRVATRSESCRRGASTCDAHSADRIIRRCPFAAP